LFFKNDLLLLILRRSETYREWLIWVVEIDVEDSSKRRGFCMPSGGRFVLSKELMRTMPTRANKSVRPKMIEEFEVKSL
jgi:hypothetical protein